MPYRVPSPPEPEAGPDADELAYARRLDRLRSTSRLRVTTFAMLLLVASAVLVARSARPRPVFASLHAKVPSACAAVVAARARTEGAHRRYVAAIRDAVDHDPGRCADKPFVVRSVDETHLPFVVVRAEDVAAGAIAQPRAPRFWHVGPRLDFVVVAKTLEEPRATGTSSYEPGVVEGSLLVYDAFHGRVLCASPITAKSSSAVGYGYDSAEVASAWLGRSTGLQASLDADFRAEIERAMTVSVSER